MYWNGLETENIYFHNIKIYYFKLSGAIKAPIAHWWCFRKLKAKPGKMIGHVVSTTWAVLETPYPPLQAPPEKLDSRRKWRREGGEDVAERKWNWISPCDVQHVTSPRPFPRRQIERYPRRFVWRLNMAADWKRLTPVHLERRGTPRATLFLTVSLRWSSLIGFLSLIPASNFWTQYALAIPSHGWWYGWMEVCQTIHWNQLLWP